MTGRFLGAVLACLLSFAAQTAPSPFDLAGPSLAIQVTRGNVTLPIAQVPHLAAGDRILIRSDLPVSSSARYLIVGAFLSGSTNPPPKSWFSRCETWKESCIRNGLTMTVPAGAQQVVVFLAPQTGGDFKTLMSTVRDRPGAFVRASQDLNQAALDRSRLDTYLSAIRKAGAADPSELAAMTPLLSRSLAIKADEKCLEKSVGLQAPCLMQGQESLILNDGHSASIVAALTSGPAGDLAMEASYTPQLGYGYYSPYFASVLDIARIFDSFRTAQYQYIPALGSADGASLRLSLNAAPSFHNPLSVLVAALPAVEPSLPPPLRAVDRKQTYCAANASLLLPVEGAPLLFSTEFAHDLSVSVTDASGASFELPARADASRGGIAVDTTPLRGNRAAAQLRGVLHGYWGFDRFNGPEFRLDNAQAPSWTLAPGNDAGVVVGRLSAVRLQARDVSCVAKVALKDADGAELAVQWVAATPNDLEVQLPLQSVKPGPLTLLITQHNQDQPQALAFRAYAEAGRLDRLVMHAGDSRAVLQGSRLDKVAGVSIHGAALKLGEFSSRYGSDQLPVTAEDKLVLASLPQGDTARASVALQDGRTFSVPVVVEGPRPRASLIGKTVLPSPASAGSKVQLTDPGELPVDSRLVFSLRAEPPASFNRDTSIDIATADESSVMTLSVVKGDIALENHQVAVVTFDPAAGFDPAVFGALRFRMNNGGVVGEWQPLVSLVRLPALQELKCPSAPDAPCILTGTRLFLIDSVSGNAQFDHPVGVPDGFLGSALAVPRPSQGQDQGQIFIRLRDNPAVVHPVTLAAEPSSD